MMYKKFFFWIPMLLAFLLIILFFLKIVSAASKMEQSSELPSQWTCPASAFDNMATIIQDLDLDSSNVIGKFPYEAYVANGNYCNIEAILKDLKYLASLEDAGKNERSDILMDALTTHLEAKIGPSFDQYNPDSLIQLLHWANQFGHYANYPSDYQLEFSVVHGFWLDYIANKLFTYTEQNSDVKYAHKFIYLRYNCEIQQYRAPIGKTRIEKVVDYFIESKYSYLLERLWNGTSWIFKLVVLMGILVTVYAFYRTIQYHYSK
ncbi:MAG: hypothetical protein AAF705_09600 [Bacteroidota bacterium]